MLKLFILLLNRGLQKFLPLKKGIFEFQSKLAIVLSSHDRKHKIILFSNLAKIRKECFCIFGDDKVFQK